MVSVVLSLNSKIKNYTMQRFSALDSPESSCRLKKANGNKTILRPFSANQTKVLSILRQNGAASRVNLTHATGLTSGTVTNIARELMYRGIVREGEIVRGQRGQPARMLELDPSGGFAFGLSFSEAKINVALLNFVAEPLAVIEEDIPATTPDAIARAVEPVMRTLLRAHNVPSERLIGLGVSVPATFYADGTLNTSSWYKGWNVPGLAEEFSKRLSIPVWCENDGTTSAVAEHLAGSARRHAISFVIYLSSGLGGGLIIDGRPFRGAHRNAGEISILAPSDKGSRPTYRDLRRTFLDRSGQPLDDAKLETLLLKGDPRIGKWIKRSAKQLEDVVRMVTHFYDPGCITLSGRIPSQILSALVGDIDLESSAISKLSPRPELYVSNLGPSVAAIGAAGLPVIDIDASRPETYIASGVRKPSR